MAKKQADFYRGGVIALLVVFVISLVLINFNPSATGGAIATGPGLTFVTPGQVQLDQQFTVDLTAFEVENLAGVELTVAYDSSKLQLLSVSEGTFLSRSGVDATYMPDITNMGTPGQVSNIVVVRLAQGGVSGTGPIARLTFRAIGEGDADIAFTDAKASTPSGVSINPALDTMTVSIGEPIVDIYGTCGSRDGVFSSTQTSWPSGSTYCATGSASAQPGYPATGSTAVWDCLGSNGGTSTTCSATRSPAPVNGVCGDKTGSWSWEQNSWPSGTVYCNSGTPSAQPSYPVQGATATWNCVGSAGGVDSTCSASRGTQPDVEEPSPIQIPVLSLLGGDGVIYGNYSCPSGAWCQVRRVAPGDHVLIADGPSSGTFTDSNIEFGVMYTYNVRDFPSEGSSNEIERSISVNLVRIDGQCGDLAQTYQEDVTSWPSGVFCSMGTVQGTPSFPDRGDSVSWSCVGAGTGTTAQCSADREEEVIISVDGVCGTRATNFLQEGITSWPQGYFCMQGTPSPSNPAFPADGQSVSWSCLGEGNGADASCSATNVADPVHATCGDLAREYSWEETTWPSGVFCSTGDLVQAPSFPSQGSTVQWSCTGQNNGGNTICSASRTTEPVVEEPAPEEPQGWLRKWWKRWWRR